MLQSFSKYSGCGNDFIIFDNRSLTFPLQESLIQQLCHRQKGIGADGVILLEPTQNAHFKMRIFNADGSEAEMCGNGIRCLVKFIQDLGISGQAFNIETLAGNLKVEFLNQDIAVDMTEPKDIHWFLSMYSWNLHYLDTGVPHAVIFCENLEEINLNEWGPKIRCHSDFDPKGVNVNFAQLDAEGKILLRTYERGVERETLACGTGATATALTAAAVYELKSPIHVQVRSGDILTIAFHYDGNSFTNIRLIGPAKRIFMGKIELEHALESLQLKQ